MCGKEFEGREGVVRIDVNYANIVIASVDVCDTPDRACAIEYARGTSSKGPSMGSQSIVGLHCIKRSLVKHAMAECACGDLSKKE